MEQRASADATPAGPPAASSDLLAHPARLVNPSTIGGTVALGVGLVLVLVPALSHNITVVVVGLGLLASGLNDLWTTARRRHLRVVTRVASALRGLVSLALAAVFLAYSQVALAATILLGAVYLFVRSLLTLLLAVVSRDRARRAPRYASAGVGLALSVVVVATPGVYTDWLAALVGVVAIVGGTIVLAYGYRIASGRVPKPEGLYPSFTEILWSWVEHADVGGERRDELAEQLYLEPPEVAAKRVAWWTMLVLSVAIATFAVLQDSTAVVIGAMLVAPLMTPILGLAAALVSGWATRTLRSLALILAGTAVAVGLAFVISSWVPSVVPFETNSQIASRVSPTLLDMLVALAAGAAGAFATADRRVASSLGGVAIAVALVPPLSVVGVSLGAGRPDDAAGALLLFGTNFVSIVLSAAVVFVLAGVADPAALRRGGRRIVLTLAPFVTAALLILLPLLLTTDGLLTTTGQQRTAQDAVGTWLGQDSTLRLADVTVAGDTVTVDLTGPADDLPDVAALRTALDDALGGSWAVEVAVTPVVTERLPATTG
ncbi:putative hydrophobic protein (TIGR00271 family) [Isoptericola jiangsuensis]|uniref:Putative hydrophobic protein (TIGR00271 family) n=1 Tax=Isoptericola jiangsuensis TaxID=548579 RepID=A0A2A9ETU0_9MICO|nr:DUF389 domain-containing protein [Isoptericola jiangsuensis]PFG42308.1 putative hydrophobic protein (TIGR00271 family) [Isoptericola jiangsuensis]